MPKRTWMALRWGVLATVAALVAGAAWCAPAGAVVGGQDVSGIDQAPYQAAIIIHGKNSYPGLWCGGSVRDEFHIITAAHCVFDNDLGAEGQPVDPSSIDVLVGVSQLGFNAAGSPTGQGQRQRVESVSLDDDYDPATFGHDAAVLTLAFPLALKPHSAVESIDVVNYLSWANATPGTFATVTGWGETVGGDPHSYPFNLQTAPVPIVSDDSCGRVYPGFQPGAMLCAGDARHDACFGDSGGPLVVPDANGDPGTVSLLGIVSFGPSAGCAIAGSPGGYTEVYDEQIAGYLAQQDPTSAPRTLSLPTLRGTVAVGGTVTCDPGAWEGSPAFTYQFVVPTTGGDVARTAAGTQRAYTIQPGDAGRTLRCDVTGRNAGGLAFAKSAAVTVPVPATPTPAPSPPQTPSPQPPPSAPPSVPSQQDSSAPVARVTKTTCTSTRCTLSVTVSDAGFSAGIRTVRATVRSTYKTTCKRKGKKVACTKRKNGKTTVKALGGSRFRVVASKLPIGRQLFTLVAVDKAGHRQALPTTKTVTTKKPKKKKRR